MAFTTYLLRTLLLLSVHLSLSAHGVSLLPYGPTKKDVTVPRGDGTNSPDLPCTVPTLFLGGRVSNWHVHDDGYIHSWDG